MHKTHLYSLTTAALCMVLSPPVLAQDSSREALYVRSLAASCASCHGTNGKVVVGSTVTSLAGLDMNYFVTQMNAFKTASRNATVMHQISKGYSDAQVAVLAGYFSAQKK